MNQLYRKGYRCMTKLILIHDLHSIIPFIE